MCRDYCRTAGLDGVALASAGGTRGLACGRLYGGGLDGVALASAGGRGGGGHGCFRLPMQPMQSRGFGRGEGRGRAATGTVCSCGAAAAHCPRIPGAVVHVEGHLHKGQGGGRALPPHPRRVGRRPNLRGLISSGGGRRRRRRAGHSTRHGRRASRTSCRT